MLVQVVKSKIHRARVTQADLNYIGSITIDEELMKAANIIEGERVQIVNNNNGERIETYTIKGEAGSGVICLNGAAARRVAVGDSVIIVSGTNTNETGSIIKDNGRNNCKCPSTRGKKTSTTRIFAS